MEGINMTYALWIYYDAKHFKEGYDDIIEGAIGNSHGSGMGFGERDHSYHGLTKEKAERLKEKVEGLGLEDLRIKIIAEKS